jgi:hypothetical protein
MAIDLYTITWNERRILPFFLDHYESWVDRIRHGAPMFGQDKRQLFDPNAITEIDYEPGRHACTPTGRVVEPDRPEVMLLHYKHIDPHAYTIPRQRAMAQRISESDRRQGFGRQYFLSAEKILQSFEWLKMHATDVVR